MRAADRRSVNYLTCADRRRVKKPNHPDFLEGSQVLENFLPVMSSLGKRAHHHGDSEYGSYQMCHTPSLSAKGANVIAQRNAPGVKSSRILGSAEGAK